MNPRKSKSSIRYLLIAVLSLFSLLPLKAQKIELEGKWVCFKKETKDGNDGSNITLNGEPYKCSLRIEFIDEHKALYGAGKSKLEEVDYKLNNDTLLIGNKSFKVDQKNKGYLILLENNANELATIAFRYYFKKE